MTPINKQNFLAELGKLLTFMYEDDRQAALAMYSKLFDDAENEQGLLQLLVSPTRQAVVIARAYDSRDRRLETHSAPGGDARTESSYAKAIGKIRETALAKGIILPFGHQTAEQISLFETEETLEASEAPEAEEEALPEPEEAKQDTLFSAEAETEPAVRPAPAPAVREEPSFVLDDEPQRKETERKARPFILILFILAAVPVCVAGIALLLIPAVLCIALTAFSGFLCFVAVSGAFGGGFAVFADMMVIMGIALVLLALALLFLCAAFWFVGGLMVGLVSNVFALGRKWCYKEVQAE